MRLAFAALVVASAAVFSTNPHAARAGLSGIDAVAVIAHSVSTRVEARRFRGSAGWAEVSPKDADFVLVVCRSSLFNPLGYSYDSYGELDQDADHQLNISGPTVHFYVYRIESDLSVTRVGHDSTAAEGW